MVTDRDGDDVDDRWALRASDRVLLGNKTGATRLGFAVLLWVKGLTIMVNSIYNGWRYEDVWLDK
jgi:hypothetical protein